MRPWVLFGMCLAAACTSRTEGMSVELGVMHLPGDDPALASVVYQDGESRGLVTDAGYGVVLYRAAIVISEIELLPCAPTLGARLRELLSPTGVAYAHGTVPARLFSTPHAIDLSSTDRLTLSLARMEPPPGDYCKLRVRVAPAKDTPEDAPGDLDLTSRSLYLQGVFVPLDDPDPQESPLLLRSTLNDELTLTIVDDDGDATPLSLSAEQPNAELRIELAYYRLLDGVDLRGDDEELAAFEVIRNLLLNTKVVATR